MTFLVWNAYVLGGTARTINQQANALVRRGHDVAVISVERRATQDEPFFPLDPHVRLSTLHDHREHEDRRGARGALARGALARGLHRLPSVLIHPREGRAKQASLLIDLRLVRALGRVNQGVVIGSRLGLNLVVARFAHPAATRIAQEHLYLDVYKPPLRDGIQRHFPKLDAVAVLTEADAAQYRRHLAHDPVPVVTVPKAVWDRLPEAADPTSRRIVAVAHLTAPGKGMDRVIPAFATVAHQHPDWELRLVGAGAPDRLEQQALNLGVRDQVHLTGPSHDVEAEMTASSMLLMPSRSEAFSLVLIEGMAAGLAVVSFDCIQGPRDILTPGKDALVVPQGDIEAFGRAMGSMMEDPELRDILGCNARHTVRTRYLLDRVTDRWLIASRAADDNWVGRELRAPSSLRLDGATDRLSVERGLPSLPDQLALAAAGSAAAPRDAIRSFHPPNATRGASYT